MLRNTAGTAIFFDAAEDSLGFASLLDANELDGVLLGALEGGGGTHRRLKHLEDCILHALGGQVAIHSHYKIILETLKVNSINNPISLFTR
jgi:hypothetical protein